jgi:hypothetical protein
MKYVIYPQENNSVALMCKAPECPLTIEEVAKKDTPVGVPYLIIDASDIPTEFDEFFEAWEADFSNPDGYGMGHDAFHAWKAQQESQEVENEDNN